MQSENKEGNTEWFDVKKILKQGSMLSPLLFNAVKESVKQKVKAKTYNFNSVIFLDNVAI